MLYRRFLGHYRLILRDMGIWAFITPNSALCVLPSPPPVRGKTSLRLRRVSLATTWPTTWPSLASTWPGPWPSLALASFCNRCGLLHANRLAAICRRGTRHALQDIGNAPSQGSPAVPGVLRGHHLLRPQSIVAYFHCAPYCASLHINQGRARLQPGHMFAMEWWSAWMTWGQAPSSLTGERYGTMKPLYTSWNEPCWREQGG
jgi:hypothetical protein